MEQAINRMKGSISGLRSMADAADREAERMEQLAVDTRRSAAGYRAEANEIEELLKAAGVKIDG